MTKTMLVAAAACGLVFTALADVEVRIEEWEVPTPNSRPHDPAIAPDGSLWYTGQAVNVLGRLDEASGEIEEFPLGLSDGPHGLVADVEGNIWYTANLGGSIGKLNPETRQVTRYPMPENGARDPHTPIFDQNGTLWFTVQGGNFVGKLEPESGKVTLRQPPTPRAQPYGIVVGPQGTPFEGVPFFAEFGSNKIGRIDPRSLDITEYTLPSKDARPRRLTITPDGMIYYTDYRRGFLGRLNPSSRKVDEWLSPAGTGSQPYGITSTSDGIWYSESGVNPNTLVRFDPETERFQTWEIPSGGGVIRHMVATPEGRLYLACSGVNQVGIVTVRRAK